MEQYASTIRKFLGRFFKEDISDSDNFFELGFVNSLFAMQLVMFLEKEYAITIGNEELEIQNFNSINAITSLIERKKGKGAS